MAAVISNDLMNGDNLNKSSGVHLLMDSMLSQVEQHLGQNNNVVDIQSNPNDNSDIRPNTKDDSAVELDSSILSNDSNVADGNESAYTATTTTNSLVKNQTTQEKQKEKEDKESQSCCANSSMSSVEKNRILLEQTSSNDIPSVQTAGYVSSSSTGNEHELTKTVEEVKEFEWTNVVEEESGDAVVLKKIIKPGQDESRKPDAGDRLRYRITTKNSATSEAIASESFDEIVVILGDYDTIGGVYLALSKMKKGELAEVLIDHSFGYGTEGRLPEVPQSCRLHCFIELLDIETVNFGQNDTFEKRFELIRQKKDRGNFWFGCNRANLALFCYQRVLELLNIQEQELVNRDELLQLKHKSETCPDVIRKIDEERDAINIISLELLSIRFASSNNMAATFLKLGMHNSALEAVNMALVIDETNVKALFRKAKIYAEINELENALKFLTRANQLDPKNRVVAQEIVRLRSQLKTQIEKDKKLYQKMIQAKKTEKETEKEKTTSTPPVKETKKKLQKSGNSTFGQYSTHLKWGLVITGVALTGFFIYKKYEK